MSARSPAEVFASAATIIRSGGREPPRIIITFSDFDAAHRAAPLLIGYMNRQEVDAAPEAAARHLAPRIQFRIDAALERGAENITIGVPLARELVAALDRSAAFDCSIPESDEQAAMERLERYVRAMADADGEDMMEWEREYGRRGRAAMKVADAEIAGALARSQDNG